MKALEWPQHQFFRPLRAANSPSWIWSNFYLIEDFKVVLITRTNEEDPIKNEGTRVATTSIFQTLKGR